MTILKINHEKIINAALVVAARTGYHKMTRREVAEEAELPPALLHYYFSGMSAIRRVTVKEAIKRQELSVVAQALALGDPLALAAPKSLRNKAARFLINRN